MTALLLIDPVEGNGWLAHEAAGAPWRPGQPLPAQVRVVALAPGEAVTLHQVEVPARRTAELRQALPYALEDRLAEPVERLHFALGARHGDGVEAAVVERSLLREWLAQLSAHGVSADRLLADTQLLPRSDDVVHVAQVGDRLLVSHAGGAWALPAGDWPAWRGRMPQRPVRALAADGRFIDADGSFPVLDRIAFLRHAATRVDSGPAIDLLQEAFAPVRRRAGQRRLWRWAAVLAGLAVVLALVDAAVGVLGERQRRDAIRTEMARIFQEALPEARMTADPAAQLVAELARGGTDSGDLFGLLAQAAPVVMQGTLYRLEALDYRLGVLELDVVTRDVAALDTLRESLATVGLGVELTGVDPGDEGVRGRLRLTRIFHERSTAAADLRAVARSAPAGRLDVASATPSPSIGPRTAPRRDLDGLVTNVHEKSRSSGSAA